MLAPKCLVSYWIACVPQTSILFKCYGFLKEKKKQHINLFLRRRREIPSAEKYGRRRKGEISLRHPLQSHSPCCFMDHFMDSYPYSEAFSLFCSLGIICHSLSLIQNGCKSLSTIGPHTLEIRKPRKVRRDHQESRSCKGRFCQPHSFQSVFHFRKAIEDV